MTMLRSRSLVDPVPRPVHRRHALRPGRGRAARPLRRPPGRIGVRGADRPARPDGPGRLPPLARRPRGRRGCLPGHVPGPHPQGGRPARPPVRGPVALRRLAPRRPACPIGVHPSKGARDAVTPRRAESARAGRPGPVRTSWPAGKSWPWSTTRSLRLPEKQQAAAVLGLVQGMQPPGGRPGAGLAAGDVQDPDRRGPRHPRPAAGPVRGGAGRDGRGRSIRVRHLPAAPSCPTAWPADARRGPRPLCGRGRGHGHRPPRWRGASAAGCSSLGPPTWPWAALAVCHSVRAGLDHRPPRGA